jgi:hypothetical protein
MLRIWTKDGDQARNEASITGSGDFVPEGEFAASDLGFGSDRLVTLYIEGIRASSIFGDARILVEVDLDGDQGPAGYVMSDAVRVTTFCLDIDTDSNNDGSIDQWEEGYEEFAPGRVICVDLEGDGPGLDDLALISLRAPDVNYGQVKLEAVEGADRVRLWKDTDKMEEVILPASWTPLEVPALLYADGIALGQVKLRLSYVIPPEREVASDTIALFVTETISYAPWSGIRTWEPCCWQGFQGIDPVVTDIVLNALKDEVQHDVSAFRYRDSTAPDGTDDFGGCTLVHFKFSREAGILVQDTHGVPGSFAAVYASSEAKVQEWIDAQGGEGDSMHPTRAANWWYARVHCPWLRAKWKPGLDQNKAIVVLMSCNAATEYEDDSCVAAAGGRVGFGYRGGTTVDNAKADFSLLFERMNGTRNNGTKRTVGKAYGDGTGYSQDFKMLANASGHTHKWTVLCPSPNAVFPSEAAAPPRGCGCIIFDTYMDHFFVANDAVVTESGTEALSDRRWFGNASGPHLVSFDFDKRIGGFITMRAVAAKCLSMDRFGFGLGRPMDGDRVKPNEDDKVWGF